MIINFASGFAKHFPKMLLINLAADIFYTDLVIKMTANNTNIYIYMCVCVCVYAFIYVYITISSLSLLMKKTFWGS
jgi:hypothetical protein